MGIRVQPREIVPTPGNAFAHDLLGREQIAEVLTTIVGNLDGPCAIAVDAGWGAGKTTFLRMWAQHLEDIGFPVVQFNAWETDFTGEPFVALSSEITTRMSSLEGSEISASVAKTKEAAKEAARWILPGVIRLLAGLIPIAGAEIGHVASNLAQNMLDQYPEARQSVKEFKSDLEDMAQVIWAEHEQMPLVVFIDELDRCRPSYAIELLETCKHIFAVDRVVFVLALNREELAHSVKALYGTDFDAPGYLRRFFDLEVRLPTPDRLGFVTNLLDTLGISETLQSAEATWSVGRSTNLCADIFIHYFGRSSLDLRTISQAVHRFGLVLSSLSADRRVNVRLLTVLALLHSVDPSAYRGFVGREMSDEEIVSSLFSVPQFAELRYTSASELLEAVIIEALNSSSAIYMPAPNEPSASPLMVQYAIHDADDEASGIRPDLAQRGRSVVYLARDLRTMRQRADGAMSVERLASLFEFVSTELISDAS